MKDQKAIIFRIDSEYHSQLKSRAAEKGETLKLWIMKAIQEALVKEYNLGFDAIKEKNEAN